MQYKKNGFTLVEILIVMGLALIIAGLSVPVGVRFYQTQVLVDTTNSIISTLRRANSNSVFQKNDNAHGVKFLSDSYVLFEGVSYTDRTVSEDEVFTLPSSISISGASEIVFSELYGTTTSATLIVATDIDNQSININAQGKIEK